MQGNGLKDQLGTLILKMERFKNFSSKSNEYTSHSLILCRSWTRNVYLYKYIKFQLLVSVFFHVSKVILVKIVYFSFPLLNEPSCSWARPDSNLTQMSRARELVVRLVYPLHVWPIAHAIWDSRFAQLVAEAFTRGGEMSQAKLYCKI